MAKRIPVSLGCLVLPSAIQSKILDLIWSTELEIDRLHQAPQSPLNYLREICKDLPVIDTGGYYNGQTGGGLGRLEWQVCTERAVVHSC